MNVDGNSKTETLESVVAAIPEKPVKNLGAFAAIYHSGQIDQRALIHPIHTFLFYNLKHGKWMEIGESTRELYVEIGPADIDKYVKNPGKWVMIGPVENMPNGIEMYALYARNPNSKLYKPTG